MPNIPDDEFYSAIAFEISKRSYAKRKKVGAIAVKDNNIIAFAYNGTPTGMSNDCETIDNVTKKEVLHAELNLVCKCAKAGISLDNSTIYITLSPCFDCAKLILQCGIRKVVYAKQYSDTTGIDFLLQNNIEVIHYEK